MNGVIIPVLRRTHFDFNYLSGSATETVPLIRALRVVEFVAAVLVVRIHVNNVGSAASLAISCFPTDPSDEDPQEFTDGTADLTASVTTQTAPFYLDASTSSINGPFWKVDLVATQGITGGATLAGQLSADLVLRKNS